MSQPIHTLAALSRCLNAARRGLSRPLAVRLNGIGRAPQGLSNLPEPLYPGEALRGRAMLGGRWMFDGEIVEGQDAPWFRAAPSEAWAEALHGFGWLEHHAALGDREAKRGAQAAAHHWIAAHGRGAGALAWRPHVIGRRIRAWLTHSALILDGSDDRSRRAVLRALARQARHLGPRWRQAPVGAPRLQAIAGAVYAGLCLDGFERGFLSALGDFETELDAQITPDGGHFGRRPSELFEVFALAVGLRRDLRRAGGVSTAGLTRAIERMAPTLRALRLGDGGLTLFNGGRELGDGRVDYVLAEAGSRAPAAQLAPEAGFGRLSARRAAVVLDAGAPGPGAYSTRAGAGLLALEASVGRQRLIVSCGPGEHLGPDWARAGRAAAAFSTLTIEDRSPVGFLDPRSFIGRWLGARAVGLPPEARVERIVDDEDGVWLHAAHTGWIGLCDLIHDRRLRLSPDGGEIWGEDLLERPEKSRARAVEFAIRFHLHPEVDAALVGGRAMLRLEGGEGWTMRQTGGDLSLEESVYLGGPYRRPRPSKQIVVRGRATDYQTRVDWAFRRVGAASPAQRDLTDEPATGAESG